MKKILTHLMLSMALTHILGCGANIFESFEKDDPATDATRALEQKKPSRAIQTLEKALAKEPGNPQFLSILSTAYAQRAGIEPLSVAESLASQSQSASLTMHLKTNSDSSLISLFGIMPAITTDRLSDIDRAVEILVTDLPREEWLAGDSFKFAIYQTASTVMHLKALDTNEDGQLSLTEILGLSGGDGLINQLGSAAAILATDDASPASVHAASAISKHKDQIEAMDGATQDEKLRNYLAKSAGVSTTQQTSP